jgi:putative hemolysin
MRLPHITTLFTTAIAIALATSACNPSESASTPATEMANPASVNCINAGGKLTIQRNPQGEIGMCKLPSGKVCEEWALFRGECL